jgi:hypothetical protein
VGPKKARVSLLYSPTLPLEHFNPLFYIGLSSVTKATLAEMREDGWFRAGRAMPSPNGETTPNPSEGYAVVFRDFFSCGL